MLTHTDGNLKIGLSQRILYHRGRAYDSLEHGWYSYLKEHALFPIQNNTTQDFDALAQELDAVILTGGDDSVLRRTCEIKTTTAMMKQLKPVLGVCHGAFLLTDLLGGKVIELPGHSDTEHTVNYFNEKITVNSYHSLAIAEPQVSARRLVTSEDGSCEAWIDGTLAAVVWHPERMAAPWLPAEINLLLKV